MKFVPKAVTRATGRAALKMRKNAPHLLFGAGIISVVGGTVLACRSTLQLETRLDEFKTEVDLRKSDSSPQEMAYIYARHTTQIVKLYAPAVIVGGMGITALTMSHRTLSRRNTALTAAYAGLSNAFEAYRGRVRAEVGEEKERDIYFAATDEVAEIDGKKVEYKQVDPNKFSLYARIFDEYNVNWHPSPELNRLFLRAKQNYFNDLLQVRGHVFLNEVYEELGFEHSSPGSIVGWTISAEGDNYIDFGMFDQYSSRFIEGSEPSVILDFNVDGVIWDKIEKPKKRKELR